MTCCGTSTGWSLLIGAPWLEGTAPRATVPATPPPAQERIRVARPPPVCEPRRPPRTRRGRSRLEVELNQGEQVGAYRVEGVLGRGGMASVYRATGPDGTTVALKLILADLADQEMFRRRFELETSIAQRVSHPNVVRVLDSGVHDGIPWLTKDLILGGSLMERLQENGALPVDEALRIIGEVASGLDAVHREGLVHRDLKPANILLKDDGTALITDFGLARDTESDTRLTRPGQTLGSMDYMAPEQIRAEDAGPFMDVYGLGCVLYECLVGVPPFADRP